VKERRGEERREERGERKEEEGGEKKRKRKALGYLTVLHLIWHNLSSLSCWHVAVSICSWKNGLCSSYSLAVWWAHGGRQEKKGVVSAWPRWLPLRCNCWLKMPRSGGDWRAPLRRSRGAALGVLGRAALRCA